MKIFMTGATGFIGKAALQFLINEGHEVTCLLRTSKHEKEIISIGAQVVSGDLNEVESYSSSLENVDVVVHAGGKVNFQGSFSDFYKINVKATESLAKIAIEANVPRFVFLSSASVVADGKPHHDIDETYVPNRLPIGKYSKSKALAEQKLLNLQDQIKLVILRPPIVWGPDMPMMRTYRFILAKHGFSHIGSPTHILSTCHINNIVEAIGQSVIARYRGVYFITDGEDIPARVFFNDLADAYGFAVSMRSVNINIALIVGWLCEIVWPLLRIKANPPTTRGLVHLLGTEFSLDDTKARKELYYTNQISVEEGMNQIKRQLPSEIQLAIS